jgi:hypothetical protein
MLANCQRRVASGMDHTVFSPLASLITAPGLAQARLPIAKSSRKTRASRMMVTRPLLPGVGMAILLVSFIYSSKFLPEDGCSSGCFLKSAMCSRVYRLALPSYHMTPRHTSLTLQCRASDCLYQKIEKGGKPGRKGNKKGVRIDIANNRTYVLSYAAWIPLALREVMDERQHKQTPLFLSNTPQSRLPELGRSGD